MITSNVITCVFHISLPGGEGTAFTVDYEARQYLVTARHVVEGLRAGESIRVFHEHAWKNLKVEVVGMGVGETDIAVLAAPLRLSPQPSMPLDSAGIGLGQQVYFLGYPFGWDGGAEYINRDFPMPFVKSGVLSAIKSGEPTKIYIDAQSNEGFSDGPLVFLPNAGALTSNNIFQVAGVIVNFPTPILRQLVNKKREKLLDKDGEPIGIEENPGFTVAIEIKHAIELIQENPIGFPLEDKS